LNQINPTKPLNKFANWITEKIKKNDFEEGSDYSSFDKFVKRENGGTTRIEYYLTISMAKELGMLEGNKKGREVLKYFIECIGDP